MKTYVKDPDASKDYAVDWSAWLATDTIATVTWLVPDGLTHDSGSDSHTTTEATIWLEGGTVGQFYVVTSRITTAGGREDDRSFRIQVANQ